jgi:hypothetical protein
MAEVDPAQRTLSRLAFGCVGLPRRGDWEKGIFVVFHRRFRKMPRPLYIQPSG